MNDTPETMQALDAILREHGELHEDTAPAILVRLCKKLERELNEVKAANVIIGEREGELVAKLCFCRDQLGRICKEGFDNQDTIGQEPADDYVLRKLAEMRKVIRQIYYDTETYADGAPDASAHDKLCSEISSKLEPYLK
jgi:hypothetical protein